MTTPHFSLFCDWMKTSEFTVFSLLHAYYLKLSLNVELANLIVFILVESRISPGLIKLVHEIQSQFSETPDSPFHS